MRITIYCNYRKKKSKMTLVCLCNYCTSEKKRSVLTNAINIVMIDSITKLCLSLLVCTNGLSYSGEETRPTLCIKATPQQTGVRNDKRNKHQLLHRIASVKTPLIYNIGILEIKVYIDFLCSFPQNLGCNFCNKQRII